MRNKKWAGAYDKKIALMKYAQVAAIPAFARRTWINPAATRWETR
jgi:hypothetical protein